jgi:hypothetical protein
MASNKPKENPHLKLTKVGRNDPCSSEWKNLRNVVVKEVAYLHPY